MLTITKTITGRLFDGRIGKIGSLIWHQPDEPTPETVEMLTALAQARRDTSPVLVGIYQGFWIQITDYYDLIDAYAVQQLDLDNGPQFTSPLSGIKMYYRDEIPADVLKERLSWLMLFDPLLGVTL